MRFYLLILITCINLLWLFFSRLLLVYNEELVQTLATSLHHSFPVVLTPPAFINCSDVGEHKSSLLGCRITIGSQLLWMSPFNRPYTVDAVCIFFMLTNDCIHPPLCSNGFLFSTVLCTHVTICVGEFAHVLTPLSVPSCSGWSESQSVLCVTFSSRIQPQKGSGMNENQNSLYYRNNGTPL